LVVFSRDQVYGQRVMGPDGDPKHPPVGEFEPVMPDPRGSHLASLISPQMIIACALLFPCHHKPKPGAKDPPPSGTPDTIFFVTTSPQTEYPVHACDEGAKVFLQITIVSNPSFIVRPLKNTKTFFEIQNFFPQSFFIPRIRPTQIQVFRRPGGMLSALLLVFLFYPSTGGSRRPHLNFSQVTRGLMEFFSSFLRSPPKLGDILPQLSRKGRSQFFAIRKCN